MEEFILKIIPVVLFFGLGFLFKRLRLFKEDDASVLLNLVFYLCMPALTYTSLMETELTAGMLYLPFIPFVTMGFTWLLARFAVKKLKLPRLTSASFLIGAMIMNTGFTLPFFYAGFGSDGFSKAIIFDIGNSFLIFSWVYFIAVKSGAKTQHSRFAMLKKCLIQPPLWALLIALIFKFYHIEISKPVFRFFELAGQPTIPLIMLALGLYFNPKLMHLNNALIAMSIRMFGGLLISYLICKGLDLDRISRIVVIGSSSAPVGYNTLVFSNLEELDVKFAATLVSFSILFGIIFIPFLFFVLNL
jgi:hypothetical protein